MFAPNEESRDKSRLFVPVTRFLAPGSTVILDSPCS